MTIGDNDNDDVDDDDDDDVDDDVNNGDDDDDDEILFSLSTDVIFIPRRGSARAWSTKKQ